MTDAGAWYFVREGDPLPPDERATASSSTTIEALYRAHAPRLLRFFQRRGDGQEASDLVQETFVRLSTSAKLQGNALSSPDAYVSQVANNLLRNRARAAFVRTVSSQPMPEEVADPLDFTAALEARDLLNRIQSAVSRLNPKTRDIFLAHRIEGATYGEIAERTNLSVKTVEWHMAKALRQLHRSLDGIR